MNSKKVVYYMVDEKTNIGTGKTDTQLARNMLTWLMNYLKLPISKIVISENGKPYFKDSNIYFNYSHSKNHIACAVSSCEVGIDIEEKDRVINDTVARKYLDCTETNEKRLETWVKKESFSKLKGLGLKIKFQDIKLNEIKNKNLFINEKEYVCCIYCDYENASFKRIIKE